MSPCIMNLTYLPIHILLFLLFLPYSTSISFQIPRFDASDTNIIYEGDAVPAVGLIELINKYRYICRVGRATYAERIPFWNSRTKKVTDFTTHFSFVIQRQESPSYGSGIAFFLAPFGYQIPPNSAGGMLGLLNTTTSDFAGNQIAIVEFDPFVNPEWDPLYPHVGINKNSIASVDSTPWNASLHDGDITDVWITYSASTTTLDVQWSYRATPASAEETTNLSYQIDLAEVLPEWVTIGFSSGSSGDSYGPRNQILSWEFNSTLDRKFSGPTLGKRAKITITIITILVVTTAGSVIGIIVLGLKLWRKIDVEPPVPVEEHNYLIAEEDTETRAESTSFLFSDILRATNNFSQEAGEGGTSTVYQGKLRTDIDTAIAVKKISSSSEQGRNLGRTEVEIISSLRHPNLVQLKGWCHDKDTKTFVLVYEYMKNGSLDAYLFRKKPALTWPQRCKIYEGLATALLYLHDPLLHQGWEKGVVHRDIKSSNILLDSSFNAKLGDFGLAMLMDIEQEGETTGWAGTQGYVDPEYVISRKASIASDIYSFGVVILEIATGRPAYNKVIDSGKGLVEWVWGLYGQGVILSAVDEELKEYDETQAKRLMMVGLWCAHPDRNERPSIREAIQSLQCSSADLPNVPTEMPVRKYQLPTPPASCSSDKPLSITSKFHDGR